MTLPDPRGNVDKLPRWAQDHLALLERRIKELEGALSDATEGAIAVTDPHRAPRGVAFDKYDLVRWAVSGPLTEYTNDWIDVLRHKDGQLLIRGSDTLMIETSSSNTFFVSILSPLGDRVRKDTE